MDAEKVNVAELSQIYGVRIEFAESLAGLRDIVMQLFAKTNMNMLGIRGNFIDMSQLETVLSNIVRTGHFLGNEVLHVLRANRENLEKLIQIITAKWASISNQLEDFLIREKRIVAPFKEPIRVFVVFDPTKTYTTQVISRLVSAGTRTYLNSSTIPEDYNRADLQIDDKSAILAVIIVRVKR